MLTLAPPRPKRLKLASTGFLWILSLLVACLSLLPSTASAREVPPLQARVNDTAEMLAPEAESELEQRLAAYEAKTQRQFAVLTIDSLDGDALEDFSIRVVEAWKLGKKGKDDGLLLLIVKSDRKLRIEVGYGLEGTITDAFSARVVRQILTPAFRAGQVERGVQQALEVLMQKAAGEDVAGVPGEGAERSEKRRGAPSPVGILALLFMLLPVVLPLLLLRGRGRGRAGLIAYGLSSLGGFGGRSGGGFSSGGGGFSGGGGSFGGGGSSGSW